jgi:hypothetical protein
MQLLGYRDCYREILVVDHHYLCQSMVALLHHACHWQFRAVIDSDTSGRLETHCLEPILRATWPQHASGPSLWLSTPPCSSSPDQVAFQTAVLSEDGHLHGLIAVELEVVASPANETVQRSDSDDYVLGVVH